MDKILIFTLCFYFCAAKIKINRLDVPAAIQYGTQEDVVLDCDFDSGGDTVMEIKWFLDGDNQIYQWLPDIRTKPRATGRIKDHIDVDYKSTNDENTMYRGLHIRNVLPELTGNYTCKVSGAMSEDVQTKRMIIYVVPEDFSTDNDILEVSLSEENSEITCSAGGFYPEPNMTIYITNDTSSEIEFLQDSENVVLTEDDYYNVSSTLTFDPESVPLTFDYYCELAIPGTPFSISRNLTHFQDDSSETQVEEDFINNSTEASLDEPTDDSGEFQFEEESNSTESSFDNSKENSSSRHMGSLLSIFFTTALLRSFL